jgi:hypothetical protein
MDSILFIDTGRKSFRHVILKHYVCGAINGRGVVAQQSKIKQSIVHVAMWRVSPLRKDLQPSHLTVIALVLTVVSDCATLLSSCISVVTRCVSLLCFHHQAEPPCQHRTIDLRLAFD